MKNTDTDYWVIKYKAAGWTSERVALKLGIPAEEVDQRWQRMQDLYKEGQTNGINEMSQQFTVMAAHFQMVGEGLKALSEGLCRQARVEDLAVLIKGAQNPERAAMQILQKFIVLEPFQFQDPQKAMEDSIAATVQKN